MMMMMMMLCLSLQASWATRDLEPGKSNAVCKDPFIEGANSLRTLSPKHLPNVREVRKGRTCATTHHKALQFSPSPGLVFFFLGVY